MGTIEPDGSVHFTAEEWDLHIRTFGNAAQVRALQLGVLAAYQMLFEPHLFTPEQLADMRHEFHGLLAQPLVDQLRQLSRELGKPTLHEPVPFEPLV
jgi:hypothetical protein